MIMSPDVENLSRDPEVLLEVIRSMCAASDRLKTENAERHQNIIELASMLDKYKQENAWLREVITARNRRLFGRKSEKMTGEELQAWLFNEAELNTSCRADA
jgi:hypothetical protein